MSRRQRLDGTQRHGTQRLVLKGVGENGAPGAVPRLLEHLDGEACLDSKKW
jgi:hypothetical protein